MATETIRRVVDALYKELDESNIRRDVRSDPSAPPPGPIARITVDVIEPVDPGQCELAPTEWQAQLGCVLTAGTSGGGGASETTIALATMAETVAGICLTMSAGANVPQYRAGAFRAFVGAGGLTKMGGVITVNYW